MKAQWEMIAGQTKVETVVLQWVADAWKKLDLAPGDFIFTTDQGLMPVLDLFFEKDDCLLKVITPTDRIFLSTIQEVADFLDQLFNYCDAHDISTDATQSVRLSFEHLSFESPKGMRQEPTITESSTPVITPEKKDRREAILQHRREKLDELRQRRAVKHEALLEGDQTQSPNMQQNVMSADKPNIKSEQDSPKLVKVHLPHPKPPRLDDED